MFGSFVFWEHYMKEGTDVSILIIWVSFYNILQSPSNFSLCYFRWFKSQLETCLSTLSRDNWFRYFTNFTSYILNFLHRFLLLKKNKILFAKSLHVSFQLRDFSTPEFPKLNSKVFCQHLHLAWVFSFPLASHSWNSSLSSQLSRKWVSLLVILCYCIYTLSKWNWNSL